jgi:ATP synthase protein I
VDAIPAVEREIAKDIVKRGLLIAPLVIVAGGIFRGTEGALGAAIGTAIVLANFWISAYAVDRVVGTTPARIGIVSVVSYVLRIGTIVAALFILRNVDAIDFATLGITLVGMHLLLLTWEAPHISMTLGAPGLKPGAPVTTTGEQ